MKKSLLMALGVLLIIMAVIYLSGRSHLAKTLFSDIISLWYVVLIVLGSIYKLTQWWRHRHDPARREQAVYSTRLFPASLHRFYFDEKEDVSKKD